MMVKDPMFVRKLRKLEKFTEDDFKKIYRLIYGPGISIIKEG